MNFEKGPMLPPSPEREPDFADVVRQKEQELFPEFKNEDFGYARTDRGDQTYFYFTPSHHVRHGLITAETVERLRGNDSLISFGAGKAYLEQLLVKGFDVPAEHITVTDKNIVDCPAEFEKYQLDMYGQWPDFGKKFAIAIFPESFGGISSVYPRGDYAGQESLLAEGVTAFIKKCLEILTDDGEMRVNGHCLRGDELYLVEQALAAENISVTWDSASFVARRLTERDSE